MSISIFWVMFVAFSALWALFLGTGRAVTEAAMSGAGEGISLSIRIAGPLCLWSGVGALMEKCGITGRLARLVSPVLVRIFPDARKDPVLAGALC